MQDLADNSVRAKVGQSFLDELQRVDLGPELLPELAIVSAHELFLKLVEESLQDLVEERGFVVLEPKLDGHTQVASVRDAPYKGR